tara:strand:- start:553 stop:684 length:132 start_codon:yes stop_codon:yes gene_type:complete
MNGAQWTVNSAPFFLNAIEQRFIAEYADFSFALFRTITPETRI